MIAKLIATFGLFNTHKRTGSKVITNIRFLNEIQCINLKLNIIYQVVDVLRKIRGQSLGLEDPEDLVAGHESDLSNSVTVSEDDTDLGRGQTLL